MFEVTSSNQPPVDQQQLQQLQQNEEIKNETTMDTTDNLSMVANPDEERKNLKRIKTKIFSAKKETKISRREKASLLSTRRATGSNTQRSTSWSFVQL